MRRLLKVLLVVLVGLLGYGVGLAQPHLTAAGFPALVLQAEHDLVADGDAVRGGLDRLPAGTDLVVVEGAVHSFFGRYGPQAGDGIPTVSRAEAEASIVAALTDFLGRVA